MRQALLMLAIASSLFAQAPTTRFSATTGDVALTAQTTAITVQPPATGAKQWIGESAMVYCSVACNVTQSKNGTAATATAGSWTSINPGDYAAAVTSVFTASNAGAGTAIGGIVHLAAGQTVMIDLSQIRLGLSGTATNYSIAISNITGTANITLIGSEK